MSIDKTREVSPSPLEQKRKGILQRFQESRLGHWFSILGLGLTLNTNGCLSPRAIRPPKIPGHTVAGLEARQVEINRLLGQETPLLGLRVDRLPPEAAPQLPEVRGFRELGGYDEATIIELLRTLPQFMVDSRNTRVVRLGEETQPMHPGYGEEFQDIHADGYATISDPEHASEAVITRDPLLRNNSPEDETKRLVDVLIHELAHPTEAAQEFYAPGSERLNSYYELLEISSNPAERVFFRYSTRIRNPDPRLQAIYTATEYHAEALTAALSVQVEEGEDWTAKLVTYLDENNPLGISYVDESGRSLRTARYAINYIMRRDPTYDPVRGYAMRQEIIGRLTEQRRANRAQTDPVLRSRPFGTTYARESEAQQIRQTLERIDLQQRYDRFVDRRLEELRQRNEDRIQQGIANGFLEGDLSQQEVINRINERVVGHWERERTFLTSLLGSERVERLITQLNQPERVLYFVDPNWSIFELPDHCPQELRQRRNEEVVASWQDYLLALRNILRATLGFRTFRNTDELTQRLHQRERALQQAYRESDLPHSPHHRELFRNWAERHFRENLTGPILREVPHR